MSEQKLYLYPKSSCDCFKQIKPDFPNGIPTNLSVTNCRIPEYFKTHNRYTLETMVETDKCGIEDLNPQVYTDKYSKSFQPIESDLNKNCNAVCKIKCNNIQYKSRDPRLYDEGHAQWTTLNSPPIDGNVRLKNVYNKNLENYGQKYKGYSDINSGQVLYYIDKEIAEPFFNPLFSYRSTYSKNIYKDPMDNIKPEYIRQVPYKNPTVQKCAITNPYCLSWINDSTQFREDLLTTQMAKRNQQKYSARW